MASGGTSCPEGIAGTSVEGVAGMDEAKDLRMSEMDDGDISTSRVLVCRMKRESIYWNYKRESIDWSYKRESIDWGYRRESIDWSYKRESIDWSYRRESIDWSYHSLMVVRDHA